MKNHTTTERGYCRVLRMRDMGKIVFIDVILHKSKEQLVFKNDVSNGFEKVKMVSIGDLIYVEGTHGQTKTGERSVFVSCISEVKKNTSGLGYEQIRSQRDRFLNRHVDIGLHEESLSFWKTHSQILYSLRKILHNNGFMEFNSGILQKTKDAGLASSFITERKNRNKYFLSMTSELKLKRLIAGGFEHVYEIGESFRNEGVNKDHLPEFTLLEAYAAEWSSEQVMELIEQIMREASLSSNSEELSSIYADPFNKIEFAKFWKDTTNENEISLRVLCEKFPEVFNPRMPEFTWIYKFICKYIVPTFEMPTFVVHIPIGFSPFAKIYSRDNRLMEGGIFVSNKLHIATFSTDNNDYEDIKKSLEHQNVHCGVPINYQFLDVLKFGIPPSAGLGLGINRMLMPFLGPLPRDVRETCLYPIV